MLSEPREGRVTFGVVGLGYWGPNLLRVLVDVPDADIRWMCDLDATRMDRLRRRYPAIRPTTRVDDVLEDPQVDAVIIATPIFTHFDLGMRSLRAGKHTFLEKPLAPSAEAAQDLLDRAEADDLVIACGHTFLYSPPVREVRRMLEADELGEVFFISSSRVNLGLHQRDVSVIWDLGPHDFSILLYWLGEMPVSVRAVGRDSIVPGVPDVAFVTLSYATGAIAHVELSWLAPSKLRRTVLVGSRKMVVYEDGSGEPIRLYDHGVVYEDPETFGEYHLSYRTGNILSPRLATYEPLAAELADFTDAVRTGRPMHEQGRLARDVVRLTEAADESLHRGGIDVALGRSVILRGI